MRVDQAVAFPGPKKPSAVTIRGELAENCQPTVALVVKVFALPPGEIQRKVSPGDVNAGTN